MSNPKEPDDNYLLDSDVVRHFFKGGALDKLCRLYKGRLLILDKVENELFLSKHLQQQVENLIRFGVKQLPFPEEPDIIKEFARLKKDFKGTGESACMAVAKFKGYGILSSNFTDIREYCDANGISYKGTMDILLEAVEKNVMTEEECDDFITEVTNKGSRLPCNTIMEYKKSFGK